LIIVSATAFSDFAAAHIEAVMRGMETVDARKAAH
jgi:hypothetical protein